MQAALKLFGMIGGPILGLFTIGIIYPWTNYKVGWLQLSRDERSQRGNVMRWLSLDGFVVGNFSSFRQPITTDFYRFYKCHFRRHCMGVQTAHWGYFL